MLEIPEGLIRQLADICFSQNHGFARIISKDFQLFIIGNRNYSPDQISILCIHALSQEIIEGGFTNSNEEAAKVN
jgi:hypothetical protein